MWCIVFAVLMGGSWALSVSTLVLEALILQRVTATADGPSCHKFADANTFSKCISLVPKGR